MSEIPEFEKKRMTTSETRKIDLLIIVERGFPTGAFSMHCPACGAHAVGATEEEAYQRLIENIRRREGDAWVR